MKLIEECTNQFNDLMNRFRNGCDSVEEAGQWNKEEYGEMDVYYTSLLVNVALRMVCADGIISKKEVDYLNLTFDFGLSVEEAHALTEGVKVQTDEEFGEAFREDVKLLDSVNPKLAEVLKKMVTLIEYIVIDSDNDINEAELEAAKKLAELLK